MFEQHALATDARKIRVEIEAAKVYIESAQLERAIQLLHNLLLPGADLPPDKKNMVLELLATIYIKKRYMPLRAAIDSTNASLY